VAITATEIDWDPDETNASNYDTGSISPTASRFLTLTIEAQENTSSAKVNRPTVTSNAGLNVTWTFKDEAFRPPGTDYVAAFLFYGLSTASPGTGTVDIDFGGQTQTRCWSQIIEWSDTKLTGVNGADAIVQTVSASDNSAAPSSTLAAFADATNNAAFCCVGIQVARDFTKEAGYTDINSDIIGVHTFGAYKVGEDTSVGCTISAGTNWMSLGSEIAYAAGNGGASGVAGERGVERGIGRGLGRGLLHNSMDLVNGLWRPRERRVIVPVLVGVR
jgi:hypothetical protein